MSKSNIELEIWIKNGLRQNDDGVDNLSHLLTPPSPSLFHVESTFTQHAEVSQFIFTFHFLLIGLQFYLCSISQLQLVLEYLIALSAITFKVVSSFVLNLFSALQLICPVPY